MFFQGYPLAICYIAIENITIYSLFTFTLVKVWLSIAMLVSRGIKTTTFMGKSMEITRNIYIYI